MTGSVGGLGADTYTGIQHNPLHSMAYLHRRSSGSRGRHHHVRLTAQASQTATDLRRIGPSIDCLCSQERSPLRVPHPNRWRVCRRVTLGCEKRELKASTVYCGCTTLQMKP
jgi:hypothetical protein